MSSANFAAEDATHFRWHDKLATDDYAIATYWIETVAPPEETAIAIAREQSAPTLRVAGKSSAESILRSTARVLTVEPLGGANEALLESFHLQTRSYPGEDAIRPHQARIRLAFPIRNFDSSLIGLWNSVVGEVHRLGFLTAVHMEDLELPPPFLNRMPGPLHGVAGLRRMSEVTGRPLFCRAARPATGLSTDDMVRINEAVLRGGFDAVKDDELTYNTALSPFHERVTRMMEMLRRVEDKTGERKLYFANVIDDFARSLEFADFAMQTGVTGVMVAPALQGISVGAELMRRTGLVVLAHNSGADILTRHPKWGIDPALWCRIQRWFGADLVLLPGNFAAGGSVRREEGRCIAACAGSSGQIATCMPVLAGGKRPEALRSYQEAVGSPDFMLIASTAVDEHPQGLEAGARAFRDAWIYSDPAKPDRGSQALDAYSPASRDKVVLSGCI